MNKIPRITLAFWIMKICATTLGETAGDLLSMTLSIGYAVSSVLLIGIFLVTVTWQLLARKYNPFLYWTVILSTSMAGTTMSDYMDRTLNLGYAKGSLILLTVLLCILGYWRHSEKSLSVEKINSPRVEVLYWTAILFSNTLGTALGDFLADDSGMGFAWGAMLIASLIGVIIILKYFSKISSVVLFWMAFILTRPLGATFGDVLTKPKDKGGLDLGTVGASTVLLLILVAFILYSAYQERKRVNP